MVRLLNRPDRVPAGPRDRPIGRRADVTDPRRATTSTIPILRIFSAAKAIEFYVEFLGFTLDFGGPAGGPFYGQIIRADTTLQFTQVPYDPGHGATVGINLNGIEALHQRAD